MRINISGCTNSCGQHHISDIGFFGAERRAHGKAAPGYQMLLGGYVGQTQIAVRREGAAPAGQERAARPPCGSSAGSPTSATPARRSAAWLDRSGGAGASPPTLKDLDEFPLPEEAPEFYVDYDETGPYVAEIGRVGVRDVIVEPVSPRPCRSTPTTSSPS